MTEGVDEGVPEFIWWGWGGTSETKSWEPLMVGCHNTDVDYTVCTPYMCLPNLFSFRQRAGVLPTVKLKLLLPLLQGIWN